jgi:hypothetical protein
MFSSTVMSSRDDACVYTNVKKKKKLRKRMSKKKKVLPARRT